MKHLVQKYSMAVCVYVCVYTLECRRGCKLQAWDNMVFRPGAADSRLRSSGCCCSVCSRQRQSGGGALMLCHARLVRVFYHSRFCVACVSGARRLVCCGSAPLTPRPLWLILSPVSCLGRYGKIVSTKAILDKTTNKCKGMFCPLTSLKKKWFKQCFCLNLTLIFFFF